MLKKTVALSYSMDTNIELASMLAMWESTYRSRVEFDVRGMQVNVKSIMSILSAHIPRNTPFDICVCGEDEEEAMAQLLKLLDVN